MRTRSTGSPGSHVVASATTQSRSRPRSAAARDPAASAAAEKSTAVMRHPCDASQSALRPSPAPRSTPVPGGRSESSATTNRFGSRDHTVDPAS